MIDLCKELPILKSNAQGKPIWNKKLSDIGRAGQGQFRVMSQNGKTAQYISTFQLIHCCHILICASFYVDPPVQSSWERVIQQHNAGTVSLVEAWAAKQPGDRTIEEMEPHQSYHSNSVWSITQITRISRRPSRTGLGCWSDQWCFGKTQLRTSNWGL